MFGNFLENVRKSNPLIHSITNYVTVNDVANMILACGASPIMADDVNEVEEVTAMCQGLNINIGTLQLRTIESMLKAGKKATELQHPVIFDPVGISVSEFRAQAAFELLKEVPVSVIKGNMSEIRFLFDHSGITKGVDVNTEDTVTKDNLEYAVSYVKDAARVLNCVVAVTGKIDLVSDGHRCYVIYNGVKQMSQVTGTGCQLAGLTACFVAANKESVCEATAAAVCAMGLAGEIASSFMKKNEGNATFRNRLIDAVYNMNKEVLDKGAMYEIR